MTQRQRRTLTRYVRTVADSYGLRDWSIAISDTPAPDDTYADISPVAGQKRAVMRIGVKFWTATPDEQRSTIVHELTHCHLASADAVINADLRESGLLATVACDLLYEVYARQREYAVDGIAEAIAGRFPALVW